MASDDAPQRSRIEVVQASITTLAVDALVNAANESLLGGGGVDAAIHRGAGAKLLAECRALPEIRPGVRCPTGEARLTGGHRLHAPHVIHAVGPVWRGGDSGEAELLASCYHASLQLAADKRLASIAFPAISCGAYGYPPEQAVPLAVEEVRAWQAENALPQRVIFCCFDAAMAELYRQELAG
ncbi:O-acetyl-ADP-ribose deacetylase [Lysobacter koreensis]|uniref:O-acetyl-ADP-ribose deacetylase n=1 Tax=Lysobacter koreensis TaxID=266122 RepID=A0ABW2YMD0_9GAMM